MIKICRSPDGKWIAYVRSDSSAVPKRAVLVPGDPNYRTFEETRFERIGGPIPTLRIGVVGVEGGPTRWVELADQPATFYMNTLGWAGNSDEVFIDKLSRGRDTREVLLANHQTGAITKAYAATDPAWVVSWVDMEPGGLAWVRGTKTFIIFSERDGWRRAYVVSRDGASQKPITAAGSDLIDPGQIDEKNGWFYHVGIAVVPKPQVQFYNAEYQEIFMRTPKENPEGDRTGSATTYAEGLRGDLLIITGSGETNTHIEITEGLVDRLIELGKRFDYFVYPNRDYGLQEGKGTELHVQMLIVRYLIEHLPAGPQ